MRRGKALCRARTSVDRVACWWKCCAARGEIARTDSQSLTGRDEGAPAPPWQDIDAEAAQSSTNGAREAGASAKLGLEAHEHGAATVVTETIDWAQ